METPIFNQGLSSQANNTPPIAHILPQWPRVVPSSPWRTEDLGKPMAKSWGIPQKWMVYKGKPHLEMNDDWGYPHLWKHPGIPRYFRGSKDGFIG